MKTAKKQLIAELILQNNVSMNKNITWKYTITKEKESRSMKEAYEIDRMALTEQIWVTVR